MSVESYIPHHKLSLTVASVDLEALHPLLSFPQGIPPGQIEVTAYKKDTSKKRRHLVETKIAGLTYQGTDFGSQSSLNDSSNYAIGVLDEASSSMQVIPVNHIFIMEALRRERNEALSSNVSTKTSLERRESLTEAFGSRKKQRAFKAAQSNTISSENISGVKAIESSMAAINEAADLSSGALVDGDDDGAAASVIDAASDALSAHRKNMLPLFNTTTTNVAEVYPTEGLILKQFSKDLQRTFSEMEESLSLTRADWEPALTGVSGAPYSSRALADLISIVFDEPADDNKRKKKLKLLYYFNMVFRFCCKLFGNEYGVAKDELFQLLGSPPQSVFKYLSDNFATYKK